MGEAQIIQPGGGGEYGTAAPADVLAGKTIGTEDGVVPGEMPNIGKVTQKLTEQGQAYTPQKGFHDGTGSVTAEMTNLITSNIRKGAKVGGIDGSFSDTSIGATAAQILEGRRGYVNGVQVDGAMPDRGSPTWTPGSTTQNIDPGRYTGGTIGAIPGGAKRVVSKLTYVSIRSLSMPVSAIGTSINDVSKIRAITITSDSLYGSEIAFYRFNSGQLRVLSSWYASQSAENVTVSISGSNIIFSTLSDVFGFSNTWTADADVYIDI